MRFLQRPAIQSKLVAFVEVTLSIAALVSGSAFVTYQMRVYRSATSARVMTEAQGLAQSCPGALTFDDVRAAATTLSAFEREPHILGAALYGKNGKILVQYSRSKTNRAFPAAPPEEGIGSDSGGSWAAHSISPDRERTGTLNCGGTS